MNCEYHPVRQGVNTCSKCGRWLCDECSVEKNGQIICKGCIEKLSGGGRTGFVHEHHTDRSNPNLFLTLLFSGLPGANYMYLGLIKRGLAILTGFFLAAYLTDFSNFMGFVVAGIWITSFFDGFRIRRKMIAGEYVADDISDIKQFFAENKTLIIGAGIALVVVEFFSGMTRFVGHGMAVHGFGSSKLVGLVIILLGIYFLRKGKRPSKKERDDSIGQ